MAAWSCRIISCHTQGHNPKPSVSNKNFVHLRASSSSVVKPKVELQEISSLVQAASTVIRNTSIKLLDAFVDSAFQFADQPVLPSQSNFAPVEEIGKRVEVELVDGKIPHDFPQGVYVRNGSNPMFGSQKTAKSMFGILQEIWVEGEGMLHALYFSKDSHGKWTISYHNKYAQTETYRLQKKRNRPAFLPATEGDSPAVFSAVILNSLRFGRPDKLLSNTNVFEHSGRCFTISENHMPHEVDISTLNTIGIWKLGGVWNRPFTSHPKFIPNKCKHPTILVSTDSEVSRVLSVSLDVAVHNTARTSALKPVVGGKPLEKLQIEKVNNTEVELLKRYNDLNKIKLRLAKLSAT